MLITWQAQAQTPNNAANLGIIANWWRSLDQKNISWKQRLIADSGETDWDPQRFDETFLIARPDVRGQTLYWHKGADDDLKNLTPGKLEFNPTKQYLHIVPESQPKVVISVAIPLSVRETLQMKNPAWFSEKVYDKAGQAAGYRLIIHDTTNLVEVEIEMDAGSLNYLRHAVNTL